MKRKKLNKWPLILYTLVVLFFVMVQFNQIKWYADLFDFPELNNPNEYSYKKSGFILPIVGDVFGTYRSVLKKDTQASKDLFLYFGWQDKMYDGVFMEGSASGNKAMMNYSFYQMGYEGRFHRCEPEIKTLSYILFTLYTANILYIIYFSLFSFLIGLIIWNILSGRPFYKTNIVSLNWIGFMVLSHELVSAVIQIFLINIPTHFLKFNLLDIRIWYSEIDIDILYFFYAGVVFLIAKAFQIGKEYQSENELTI